MVNRQYELMRRPRMLDEVNNSKNPIRADDVDMPNSVDHPAPNTATEAPVSDHEVSHIVYECIRSAHYAYIFVNLFFDISISKFSAYATCFVLRHKNMGLTFSFFQ